MKIRFKASIKSTIFESKNVLFSRYKLRKDSIKIADDFDTFCLKISNSIFRSRHENSGKNSNLEQVPAS